jgi:hypothetical protein
MTDTPRTTDALAGAVLDSLDEPDAWRETTPRLEGRQVGAERWFNRDNIRLVFDDGRIELNTFTPDRARLLVSTVTFDGASPELIAAYVSLAIEDAIHEAGL